MVRAKNDPTFIFCKHVKSNYKFSTVPLKPNDFVNTMYIESVNHCIAYKAVANCSFSETKQNRAKLWKSVQRAPVVFI